MKKVYIIIIYVFAIVTIILNVYQYNLSKPKTIISNDSNISNKLLSMMVENEKGAYEESENNEWPSEEYILNKELSGCENGGQINYQNSKVRVTTLGSDRCYVYFDFDKENYVRDLSGNENHGKIVNVARWDSEGITTSDENKIGYVDCGFKNYDFKDSIAFVMKLKFNKLNNSIDQKLISNYEGAGAGIWLDVTNHVHFNIYDIDINPPNYVETGASNTVVNTVDWYTIIGTYDGQELSLYINNIKEKSVPLTGRIKASIRPLTIGINLDSGEKNNLVLEGPGYITIYEILIFDRSLTNEEITQDFSDKINPVNKEKLLVWYKFTQE